MTLTYRVTTTVSVTADGPVNAAWAAQDQLANQFANDPYLTFTVSEVIESWEAVEITDPVVIDLNNPPMCTAETHAATRIDQAAHCEENPNRQDNNGDWWCPNHQPQPDDIDLQEVTE